MIKCEWCEFIEENEFIDTYQYDLCVCCRVYMIDMCEMKDSYNYRVRNQVSIY
jgi:hypothetical protein